MSSRGYYLQESRLLTPVVVLNARFDLRDGLIDQLQSRRPVTALVVRS
jgi:hypothetical protein